ncbi:hypothetical protein CC78DRAFT_553203 [Lojkania enalia]|uniref:CCD97-like C-terminal domain-containing protein n=1 Tax=Lojkania enalia TaxID=147567 RepID=A0A9P4KBE4_9PLEO|nr:hypothetical protein CC78DRAFT_553203 [Didymosphaeria enalia]
MRDNTIEAMRTQQRLERGDRSDIQLKVKNRRKRYLEMHPEYFEDYSLELADPLLYDRLIRRFQTDDEREVKGCNQGLEAVIARERGRVEGKQDLLQFTPPHSRFVYKLGFDDILGEDKDDVLESMDNNGNSLKNQDEDNDAMAESKEEGKAWWVDEMTQRFLRGGDENFDYTTVDGNHKYDHPEEERDIEDAYFDSMDSDFDTDGEGKEKVLTGETGIQDY